MHDDDNNVLTDDYKGKVFGHKPRPILMDKNTRAQKEHQIHLRIIE